MIARNRITGIVQAGYNYKHRFVESVQFFAPEDHRLKVKVWREDLAGDFFDSLITVAYQQCVDP